MFKKCLQSISRFFDFAEKYDEKELKDALIEKVNNFLMELGTGFAYMGREVRIEVEVQYAYKKNDYR